MVKLQKQLQDNKDNTEDMITHEVGQNFFKTYKRSSLGKIDFTIADKKNKKHYYLWAEAKQSKNSDPIASITQLILTIYVGQWYCDSKIDKLPTYLGAFDPEKIFFVPYKSIKSIFLQLLEIDPDRKIRPSDHNTKEFKKVYEIVDPFCKDDGFCYSFEDNEEAKELKKFIANKFNIDIKDDVKTEITDENFVQVFKEWQKKVKDTIKLDWEGARKGNIDEIDFFLADLFSNKDNIAKNNDLYAILDNNKYVIYGEGSFLGDLTYGFNDNQEAHKQFWNKYERPPEEVFWSQILERRDRLVSKEIRKRKGAYYTPEIWVKKSQEYLSDVLGDNWQEKYYIWDCAAGTGNLLQGLRNKRNIFASTLDKPDVSIIKWKVRNGKLSLLEGNIFQFDFLNDDLNGDKVPCDLKEILNNPKERKNLIIYINPPYAEAADKETQTKTGKHKTDVSVKQKTYQQYSNEIGLSGRELYAQFFIKIYREIPEVVIAQFSTLKTVQKPSFAKFRQVFQAKLKKLFVVPAQTFELPGKFPIGFFIWDTSQKEVFKSISADVYNKKGEKLPSKEFRSLTNFQSINDWIIKTRSMGGGGKLGFMFAIGADFQHNNANFIVNDKSQTAHPRGTEITWGNLIEIGIYMGVRHCMTATWLNDADQFLHPKDTWKDDTNFHTNCLIFTLFHGQNKISAEQGVNHWIPFSEDDVGARSRFQSTFMTDFIKGKIEQSENDGTLLQIHKSFIPTEPLNFSQEAQEVFNAGREIWSYYHKNAYGNPAYNVNASFYNIKEFFKGRNEKTGRMIDKSKKDEHFKSLEKTLSEKMKILAKAIEPKVYEHGFLIK